MGRGGDDQRELDRDERDESGEEGEQEDPADEEKLGHPTFVRRRVYGT
jgi:hypothetical protein